MMRIHRLIALIFVLGGVVLSGPGSSRTASAHAELMRSFPEANAVLDTAPTEIRLWFSEPPESEFSRIILQSSRGEALKTDPARIDPTDPLQMFLPLGTLPDGIYTVTWEALSASDGHLSRGTFIFSIGIALTEDDVVKTAYQEPQIAPESVVIRWINLVTLALLFGGIGFQALIWRPAGYGPIPAVENRIQRQIVIGWLALGIASLLLLMHQVALTTGTAIGDALHSPDLLTVILETRFGGLWLARMAIWALLGLTIQRVINSVRYAALSAGLCLAITLIHSLYSHASAAPDAPAVLADWLHLGLTALWIGGLIAFFLVIGPVRRHESAGVKAIDALVGYFSIMGRILVIGLIFTGLYAAWLQVGSIDALYKTSYGRALLLKLALFAPLIVIAAINLLITARQLRAGRAIWSRILRGLVGAEIALTLGVLLAVAIMTSTQPGRSVLAHLREVVPPPNVFYEETMVDNGMHIGLEVAPGYAGQNRFEVFLWSMNTNEWIENATLVRLRFTNPTERLNRTEIDLQYRGKGNYSGVGANLSLPGEWRVRVIVRVPDAFDQVVEFAPKIKAPPPDSKIDPTPGLDERGVLLLALGVTLLASGGFGLVSAGRSASRLVAFCLLGVAILCLVNGLSLLA